MNRGITIQLGLFLLIAALCGVFVLNTLFGHQSLQPAMHVTVRMADAGGLAPTSDVTYRGVPVGKVDAVEVDARGIRLEISIDSAYRVPASTHARVSMDTPMAIQHLDLQPTDSNPPYLREGSVIRQGNTSKPLPLESLLVRFMNLADSLNTQDIATLSEALSSGLGGSEAELSRILNNTNEITQLLQEREPQIKNLLDKAPGVLNSVDAGNLRELASSMRELTQQAREQEPAIRDMLDTAPNVTAKVTTLLRNNEQSVSALMGNLVTTAQIVSTRTPALDAALYAVPNGLNEIAGMAHGDTADFYLVVSQGPVCYYGTQRRLPTDTSHREPELGWACAPDDNLSQRGAASRPRPSTTPQQAPVVPAPETTTPSAEEPFQLGSGGGQSSALGSRSWYSIYLQGVR